jgi:hypothetical protein
MKRRDEKDVVVVVQAGPRPGSQTKRIATPLHQKEATVWGAACNLGEATIGRSEPEEERGRKWQALLGECEVRLRSEAESYAKDYLSMASLVHASEIALVPPSWLHRSSM